MSMTATDLIRALGGTTAVARLTDTPISTVHSWRTIGVPKSRLAHLRLVVQANELGVDVPEVAPGTPRKITTAPSEQAAA